MKYINNIYENEIVINKSVFICHLYPVKTVEEVNSILQANNKKYYDATHNCYAYILGDNQEIQKASDDGEPQKTAGFPMMDVLKKNNMTNILAIVTRYFGGILLGAGGLVRAYSSSVSECLKLAKLYVLSEEQGFILTTTYSGYNTLLKVINYINIVNISYTTDVIIEATTKENNIQRLKEDLFKFKIDNNITLGEKFNVLVKE